MAFLLSYNPHIISNIVFCIRRNIHLHFEPLVALPLAEREKVIYKVALICVFEIMSCIPIMPGIDG